MEEIVVENKEKKIKKPIVLIVIIVSILAMLSLAIYNYIDSNKVVTKITLDINPSIELHLNKNNKVVEVVSLNDDSKDIITDNYKGKSIAEAVSNIASNLVEKGYITSEDNTILISVEGNNTNLGLEEKIKTAFREKKVECNVIVQKVDSSVLNKANEYNITNSKASYIEQIVKENPEYKFEDLTKMTINELSNIEESKEVPEEKPIKEQEESNNNAPQETNNNEETNNNVNNNNEETNNNINNNIGGYGEDTKCANYKIESEEAVNKSIADAGLSNEYVPMKNGYLTEYNGTCAYEVTFKFNKTDYVYYVNSVTGAIIHKNVVSNTTITESESVLIAMNAIVPGGMSDSPITLKSTEKTTYNGISAFKVINEYKGVAYTHYISEKDGSVLGSE